MSLEGIFPIDKWDFRSDFVFSDLPRQELNMLTRNVSRENYSKGQNIFREGGYPGGIYYIREGKTKKYKVDHEGREQIIYVANKGELIGYHALLAEERYPDSASALENSIIDFIPREDFLEVLNTSKLLSNRLLKCLSHEFAVFANNLALFGQRNVRERFATQLILMREKYKKNFSPGMEVEINLSRGDWASLVGTARENIVRIIKEFKDEKILRTNGTTIIIIDVKKLLAIINH